MILSDTFRVDDVDESKQPVAASPPAGLRNPVNPYRKSTPVKPLQNIVDDRKPEGTRRAVSAFPKPAASSVPSSPVASSPQTLGSVTALQDRACDDDSDLRRFDN